MANTHLSTARVLKDDEYYTRFEDVADELINYKDQLRGRTVYCNADGPESAFTVFFTTYFHVFGLRKLFCTGLSGKLILYDGLRTRTKAIDGDFRSSDCRNILMQSDVVITNPPFSKFRAWLEQVKSQGKDFLVIGNKNAVSTKDLFPMIQSGSVKLGYTKPALFYRPDGSVANKKGVCWWFTTLETSRTPSWTPTASYATGTYQKYDHYPAVNVDRISDIPDYDGLLGVPITFLDSLDRSQWEIVDLITRYAVLDKSYGVRGHQLTEIEGKPRYPRIIIKKK